VKREIQNFLKMHRVQRGSRKGVSTYAAAYRAGETLWDDRTGNLYKYSWRKDVKYTEIVLPTKHHGNTALSWARDRSTLWNAVERSERRRDAKVAREYTVVLPSELTASQRVSLARGFAQAIADRYQIVVDVAIHEPRLGRAQNHHAHLLTTTREIPSDGFGAKTRIEGKGADIKSKTAYVSAVRAEYRGIRALWTQHLERGLEDAGIARGTYDLVSKQGRGVAAETSPKSWSESNAGSFLKRALMRLTGHQDRKAIRHTPSERELVKRRKEAIRSSREAELKRRRVRTRQRVHEYEKRNRARINQRQRKNRQRDPERTNQRQREYRRRNRVRINRQRRAHHQLHRERLNQQALKYRQQNRPRVNQWQRGYVQRHRDSINQKKREDYHRNRERTQPEKIVETPQVQSESIVPSDGAAVSPEKIQRQSANEWSAHRKEQKDKDKDRDKDDRDKEMKKEMKRVKDRGLEL
jgi:MobA/MobL family